MENNFGKNLKYILHVLGMSQAEFAKKAGITPACVNQIIKGTREPGLNTILKITKTLQVKFEVLIK